MRHVRDEFPALPVGGGEVTGHLVERVRELPDLVARRGAYPPGVVPAGHRPGGGGHLAQRRRHAVRQELRGDQRQPDGRERGDRGQPFDLVPEVREPRRAGRHDQDAQFELDRPYRVERSGHRVEDGSGFHACTSRA